jgi:hypothetical protein
LHSTVPGYGRIPERGVREAAGSVAADDDSEAHV